MPKQKLFFKFLHEPLFHFLLIGLAFFLVFYQLNPSDESNDDKNILITQAKVDAMGSSYLKQRGRSPMANELQSLIESEIKEEVLYREAMALGLDKEDGVIRRRLAQKMKYLFEDLAVIDAPSETDLETFFKAHASEFTLAATRSFYQVYFDPKMHKDHVEDDLKTVLEDLKSISLEKAFSLGDRSLLAYHFVKRRESDVKNRFGESFSKSLFSAPIGSWQGPFESAYGIHFVYIDSKMEAVLPELKQVRDDVLEAYKRGKTSEANDIFYKSIKDRYKIKVEKSVLKDTNISIES